MAEELSLGDRRSVQVELEKRKEEASFIGWVEKKEGGKKEKVILVVGSNRLILLKSGGKVTLTFRTFKAEFASRQTDEIINCVVSAVDAAFPGVPQALKFKLEVTPPSRLREQKSLEQPLGGFVATYKSICDYYSVEPRDDIIWDMENLFGPGQIKDFNLKELELPVGVNEIKTLIGALQYNTYFRSLIAKNLPFDKNMITPVAECLKFNTKLDELTLSKISMNKEGIAQISEALSFNKTLALTSINISGNNIEDRGITALASYIGGLNRGLVRLDVSSCGIGKLGMAALGNALKKNPHMASTLTFFNISNNKLEGEGSAALASFLANPNMIRSLLLSNAAAQLDTIMGALPRGCCEQLHTLDLSGNKFTKKEATPMCKFLQASAALSSLNLRDTGVPVDALKDIVTAASSNPYLQDLRLNLGENKFGVPGARVLASVADKLNNIISLDLSDNEFGDEGISIVTEGLCYNSKLKTLVLDKNFKGRSKNRSHAVQSLINLIGSSCPLESLSIQGGPKSELKEDILLFLYALGVNQTLKSLDISGNQMGNKGASALGKALQTNDTLETLMWDKNETTLQGFQMFHIGLKRNFSLKTCPMPINDISAALKGSSTTELNDIVSKIEQCLQRNQNPTRRFQNTQEDGEKGASSFAFLIKSTGRKVTSDEARLVLEEAESQDQVMTSLYSVDEQIHQEFEHELRKQLLAFVKNSSPLFSKMKSNMIEQLMTVVKKSYKSLPEEVIKRLQTTLSYTGKELPEEEFEKILLERAYAELSSKAASAFHSTVTTASDYLYEKMQDQVMDILDELTSEVQQESAPAAEEVKGGSKIKPLPTPTKKTAPSPTPAKKGSTPSKKAPVPPSRDKKPGASQSSADAHVEILPKAQSNLQHATKERPMAAGRRAPTRKPRPAPPQESQM